MQNPPKKGINHNKDSTYDWRELREQVTYYNNLENACDTLEDHYAGKYKSLTEFAQEITEETTQIPANLRFYIDYETMARDLEINDVFTIETGFEEIHVFWTH